SFQLSACFQRLTLRLETAEHFDDRGIHFRFVLPDPANTKPEWPKLAANGATRWPVGDKELHRPVYTVRAQRDAEIDVDVFQHKGGLTSEWSRNVKRGEKVALIGPGGGGVLTQSVVVLAGDETAYPAISRILDSLDQDATAKVVLLSQQGYNDYPIPERPNTMLRWVAPISFVRHVEQAITAAPDCYAWIAAESNPVTQIRESEAFRNLPKTHRLAAVYWTAGKGSP
ncbi:MAG: siderophore-interacting protein, partial [Pseudomonadota bacterium]